MHAYRHYILVGTIIFGVAAAGTIFALSTKPTVMNYGLLEIAQVSKWEEGESQPMVSMAEIQTFLSYKFIHPQVQDKTLKARVVAIKIIRGSTNFLEIICNGPDDASIDLLHTAIIAALNEEYESRLNHSIEFYKQSVTIAEKNLAEINERLKDGNIMNNLLVRESLEKEQRRSAEMLIKYQLSLAQFSKFSFVTTYNLGGVYRNFLIVTVLQSIILGFLAASMFIFYKYCNPKKYLAS